MSNFDMERMKAEAESLAIKEMFSPVRCTHCGQVYDVGTVTVTARYSDCSVWVSPCCGRTVDDRNAGWKPRPDIEKVSKNDLSYNRFYLDEYGDPL